MNKISCIVIFFTFLFSLGNEITVDNCVSFKVKTDRQDYFPGENIFLELEVDIADGFHIYSVDPSKSLASSYIEFLDTTLFDVVCIMHEPETYVKYDSVFSIDVHYHKNKIKFIQDLKLSDKISSGEYTINSIFNYFACY